MTNKVIDWMVSIILRIVVFGVFICLTGFVGVLGYWLIISII